MKRTLLLLTLVTLVSGAYGQTLGPKFTISDPGITTSHKFGTLVRMEFSPKLPDKYSTISDSAFYRMVYPRQTLLSYQIMIENFPVYHTDCCDKYVDIRFRINGRTTDYTFEEFRKILWP